ncbi:MAG: hypothetical protein R3Y32_06705 [Bacillota bacterium]
MRKKIYKLTVFIVLLTLSFALFSGFTWCPYCSELCEDCGATGSSSECIDMTRYISEDDYYSYAEDEYFSWGYEKLCLDIKGTYVCELCWTVTQAENDDVYYYVNYETGIEYISYTCPNCENVHIIQLSDIVWEDYSYTYYADYLTAVFFPCEDFSFAYGCQAEDCATCDGVGYSLCNHPTVDTEDLDIEDESDSDAGDDVPTVDTTQSATSSDVTFFSDAFEWVEANIFISIIIGGVVIILLLLLIKKMMG